MTNPNAPARGGTRRTFVLSLAFLWGLAEATVFFVVPDVYLTRVALRDLRGALLGAVAATIGAVAGGVVLWSLAHDGNAPELLKLVLRLPAVSWNMAADSARAIHEQGVVALFAGGFTGVPYKLFAVHAGAQGIGLAGFVAASVAARLLRFAVTSLLAALIGRALSFLSDRTKQLLHTVLWTAFYALLVLLAR